MIIPGLPQEMIDVKWYMPEMSDVDIDSYWLEYRHLPSDWIIEAIVEAQLKKNLIIDADFINSLRVDDDFKKIYDRSEDLTTLTPEYFTNEDITNFINHHATNVKLVSGLTGITSVKIPSRYFEKEDIAFSPEGVYYKNHFIYLCPQLLSLDGFWEEFIEVYSQYRKNGSIFKIRLNYHNAISLKHYRRVCLDKYYGYGKPFKDDNLFITDHKDNGYVVHIRNEGSLCHAYQTEFYISKRTGSLQIEELSDVMLGEGYYINRYIHCEFDQENRKVTHFDGKYLYYTAEEYEKRKQIKLGDNIKCFSHQVKLFRIDGEFDLSNLKILIEKFFIGNEMIVEYFDKDRAQEEKELLKLNEYERYQLREKELKQLLKKRPHIISNNTYILYAEKDSEKVKKMMEMPITFYDT